MLSTTSLPTPSLAPAVCSAISPAQQSAASPVPVQQLEMSLLPPPPPQSQPPAPPPLRQPPGHQPQPKPSPSSASSSTNPSFVPKRLLITRTLDRLGELGDTWTWEVASMMLSLASMAAIVIVLVKYDGRVFPSVPGDISLNAIVATLSTISKTSLIFSVSSVLGQLKWDWFEQQPRPLEDLDTFDQASRGPLGATKLLLGGTARSVASIGAVITILALALDPFVQQVVGTAQEESYISSGDVWVQRQTTPSYYPRYYGDHDPEYLEILNGAFWNDAAVYNRPAHCPSGNCRFESFDGVEFCVDSEIITDLDSLKLDNCSVGWDREEFPRMAESWKANGTTPGSGWTPFSFDCIIHLDDTHHIFLPVELSLQGLYGAYTNKTEAYTIEFAMSAISLMSNFNRLGHPSPGIPESNVLTRMASVRVSFPPHTDNFRNAKLEWVETAVLSLCKTTRTVTVTNGVTNSVITKQTFGEIYMDDSIYLHGPESDTSATCWSSVADGSRRSPDKSRPIVEKPGGANVTVDPTTMNFCASSFYWGVDIKERLPSVYMGTKTIYRPQGASADDDWSLGTNLMDIDGRARLVGSAGLFYALPDTIATEDTHKRVQNHTLGAVFQSVAAALNNFSIARSTEEPVRGSVKLVVAIVKVRWPWLVLPLVVEALGLVLLVVATVFSKRRVAGLWKDSLLAVLYHGLDRADGRLDGESAKTITDMKTMAKGTRVGLVAQTTMGERKVLLASK